MADVATLGIQVRSTGVDEARRQMDRMQRSAVGAEQAAAGLERQALMTSASIARAFGAGAVTGIFAGAIAGLKSMKTELLEIDRISRMTNLSLNQVNSLGLLGRMNGVSPENLNRGLTGVAEKLNEARREENDLTKLLEANNQKYKDREGNVIGVNQALEVAAGLIASAATNLDRVDIAKKLGLTAEWVPLLENGVRAFQQARAEADILAGTIDRGVVQAAKDFDAAWNRGWATFGATAKAEISAIAAALQDLANKASGFISGLNQRFQSLFPQTYANAPAGVMEVPPTATSRPAGMSDATWRTLQNWLNERRDTSRDFSPWERLRQTGGGGFRSTRTPGSGGGGAGNDNESESSFDRALRQLQEQTKLQEASLQALGQETAERERIVALQRAMNVAARDGEGLTADQKKQIEEAAAAYGRMAAAIEKAKQMQRQLVELNTFARDTVKGFFSDFTSSLAQGENAFKAFGDAALRALQRIADKLIEMALQSLWTSAFGGGGGLLSMIFGSFGGGSTAGVHEMSHAFAKGGAFSGGNVIPFASGGVVSRPTLFPMANGAGLMGEAGPEGILPLRRNQRGQLGVMAQGGGGMSVAFSPVTNITIQGGADNDTLATLKAELDKRDQRLRQEMPAVIARARRDGIAA